MDARMLALPFILDGIGAVLFVIGALQANLPLVGLGIVFFGISVFILLRRVKQRKSQRLNPGFTEYNG